MFEIGDIVKVNSKTRYSLPVGKIGTVVIKDEDGLHYGIEFGEGFRGHRLGGFLLSDTGFWIEDYALERTKQGNKDIY